MLPVLILCFSLELVMFSSYMPGVLYDRTMTFEICCVVFFTREGFHFAFLISWNDQLSPTDNFVVAELSYNLVKRHFSINSLDKDLPNFHLEHSSICLLTPKRFVCVCVEGVMGRCSDLSFKCFGISLIFFFYLTFLN